MATLADVGLVALRRQVHAEYASPAPLERFERLPDEVEKGNVEYKQQLLEPSPDRLRQLTTQMHWRLNEGRGTAFYEVGVKENGEVLGLAEDVMLRSLGTLARMCRVVNAEMSLSRFRAGRDASHKAVRIQVTRVLQHNATKRLRVSLIGDFESGKSTLVGVLTRGCLDDGAGLARMQVCRHRHELENGCTSSVSEHTIAVAADGHFRCTELPTCNFGDNDEDTETEKPRKQQESFITLSDLAGHKKYLKSTASGLAGQFPDYAMLVVDAVRGVRDMTREHLKIATALNVAIFVVVTKTDLVTDERIQQCLVEVADLLKAFCPCQRLLLAPTNMDTLQDDPLKLSTVPVFQISNVDGIGLDVLQAYLAMLEPERLWATKAKTPAEFQVTQAYDIEDAGTTVTGLVHAGTLCVGEQMLLGPDADGQFCEVAVESIEVQHKAAQSLSAGETGAVLIRFLATAPPLHRLRKGTMLVHPSVRPMATRQFDAELHFLPDARAFRENFEAVIHTGQVRQMAKIVRLTSSSPTKLQPATTMCRFEFMYWPEYIRPDLPLVLREGKTQAVGRVVRAVPIFHKEQQVTRVPSC
ncbi:Elongation factor Tu GTP binding domain [Phytophthora infestans]|uniref:Elongation factor Tu, chloroplastic n=2 Tax=Phytophthora infestans TaxID=4787 RepID=A0A833W4N1_PHYIN|nr:Elongation factor Tu GTP binding domain [Phytophthora infestans]KAF4135503.1 Elongation factor Tu GTP binding domain [Phytophthora infestans]KAF4136069.1 Elongation factor Tu GTP binding domain [Phytophthora infestans]